MFTPTSSIPQLCRAGRHYHLFREINDGIIHNQPSTFYEDRVYDFFVNCYHVKDWIKQDPAVPALSPDPEAFISQNAPLAIAADICNGVKHFSLSRPPRSGVSPSMRGQHIKLFPGSAATAIQISYTITTSTGDQDAFAVATACMDLWEMYLGIDLKVFHIQQLGKGGHAVAPAQQPPPP